MRRYRLLTPDGMRDMLFSECAGSRELEKKICKIFSRACYNEVRTPVLEFYDVFSLPVQPIPLEEMYKLSDTSGRLLALRPDNTLPIIRLAASKLRGARLPLRIYYNQPSFRISQSMRGGSDETAQAGVELIGAGGRLADLEVLSLAVDALTACLSETRCEFRFEIGHSGIFRSLASALDVTDERREEMRIHIESKNYAALSAELEELPPSPAKNALLHLPRLFGGEEVLARARELISDPETVGYLDYLGGIYNILCELGLRGKVIIDLGLVQRNDYYTGIVFSAYAPGSGESILTGGRYDRLLPEFEVEGGAIGFAFNLAALTKATGLSREADPTLPETLIVAQPGCEQAALRRASNLRENGIINELSHTHDVHKALDYANSRGINRVELVTEGGVEIVS